MFDFLPNNAGGDLLARVQRFFFDNGHDLALAASLLAGAAAQRRVIACEFRIQTARRLDRRSVRDLVALHALLSLEHVGDPDKEETAYFAKLHPASEAVETICRLTDILADLLRDIEAAAGGATARSDLRPAH